MDLAEFYAALLPADGWFCLWEKRTERHHWFNTQAALVNATRGLATKQPDWYYATASFTGEEVNGHRRRWKQCVVAKKALHADLDAGDGKPYADAKEAVQALVAFTKATGLRPSIVVASGRGIHVYWELDKAVTLGVWQPLADALAALAAQHGLHIDKPCTIDSSRLLRPPGSLHNCGKHVEAKRLHGAYTVEELRSLIALAPPPAVALPPPAPPPNRTRNAVSDDIISPMDAGVIPDGTRDTTLFRLACRWRNEGAEYEEILERLREENQRCEPPVPDDVLEAKARSAMKYNPSVGCVAPTGERLPTDFPKLGDNFSVRWQEGAPMLCVRTSNDDGEKGYIWVPLFASALFYVADRCSPVDEKANAADSGGLFEVRYRRGVNDWDSYELPYAQMADSKGLARLLAGKGAILLSNTAKNEAILRSYVMEQVTEIMQRHSSVAARDCFGFQPSSEGTVFAHGDFAATKNGFRKTMLGKQLRGHAKNFSVPCLSNVSCDTRGGYVDDDVIPRLIEAVREIKKGFAKAYPDNPDAPPDAESPYAPYRFAAALALAAPLMLFFGSRAPDEGMGQLPGAGIGLNLYSQASGHGKSVLQELCALTMANPGVLTTASAIGQGYTSVTAVTAKLKLLNSYPLMMDEITTSDPEALSSLYYSLALGSEKSRASQSGGLLEAGRWATVALSSSNRSVRDMLSSVRRTGAAEQLRLLELNLDKAVLSCPKTEGEAFLKTEVYPHFNKGCGAVPLLLANYALRDQKNVMAAAVSLQQRVMQTFNMSTQERFYARAMAAALLAQNILASYAKAAGLEPEDLRIFSTKDIKQGFAQALANSREHIESAVLSDDSLVMECIRALSGHILVTDTMGDLRMGKAAVVQNEHDVRAPLVGRRILDSRIILLSRVAVREWCAKNHVGYTTWVKAADRYATRCPQLVGSRNVVNLTRGVLGRPPLQTYGMAYILPDTEVEDATSSLAPVVTFEKVGGSHA